MTGQEIWVVAEHRGGELREVTLEMLREGKRLAEKTAGKLCAVLLGNGARAVADTLGRHGADRVYLAEDPCFERYTTDAYAAALADLIRSQEPLVVIFGATPYGRDLAPCLAARLRAGLLSGCVMLKINDEGVLEGTRPAYGGKVYGTVSSLARPFLATIRPGVIGVDKPKDSSRAEVVEVQPAVNPAAVRTRVTGFVKADPAEVDLTEAEVIVSGGRGVGSPEQWRLIEELAEAVRGSVGGSRVAMDAGWIPRERMVGQTGRTVAPRCYLAAGISGASAHINGIKDARLIIAINRDRAAPIFKMADMGVVGDLHQILPAVIRRLKAQPAGATGTSGAPGQSGTGGARQ